MAVGIWQALLNRISRRVATLEGTYVRSTRFVIFNGPGTSGAVTLPPNSTVILDDFGGTVDAVVTSLDSGRPTLNPVYSASGSLVATSFDSGGNFTLTSTPAAFPVAVVYRIQQELSLFDSDSTDIIGETALINAPSAIDGGSL